ncbi:hypothetical protein BC629DRAFT_1594572 [Irpex lacteus]|nr:hypothetical protein BC629DRAFT_1594572 [Irpex lacteus]
MASNLEVAGSPSRESKPVNLIPNTNLPPNHPDLDSKTIKQWYRQCQKCWKRKADGVKLMVCSKCKIASYCSAECQKADWSFHKQACKANQRRRELMAREDLLERLTRNLTGEADDDRPTNTEVNDELGEFLRRFRPIICQASYRCFEIQNGQVDAWKKYVFVVRIERIPKPSKHSKPWSRYKVVDVYKRPLEEVKKDFGNSFIPTLKQGEVYHQENVGLTSWAGYGQDAWDDDVPVADWKGEFIRSVEKICGRMTWYADLSLNSHHADASFSRASHSL